MKPRTSLRVLTTCVLLGSQLSAQELPFTITKPSAPSLIAPYLAPGVPSIRLYNSERIRALIRAGNLYLSVQDAIALAIENNLNLEVNRYGILLADTNLERARAGGPLRGVPSASQQVCNVTGGLGVNGSASTAGLSNSSGCIVGGSGTGAATIQQVGAVTPNLDPVMQSTGTFGHLTQPQANTQHSQTHALIESVSTSNTTLQQGFLSGGTITFRNFQQGLKENSPSDTLNPAVGPHMDLILRHNLLQGFGVKLNDRGIRIATMNVEASRETFRSQLLDLVTNVLNLYWDVVAANDEVGTRQRARENAEKFVEDTKKEIAAGGLPPVELPRAEAQLAKGRMDVIIAQANLRQRSNSLKEAIVRVPDPAVEAAEIIPTDRIEVPDTEDLPPLRQLLAIAMEKRPDVAVARFRDQTSEMALAGTANPLLPSLSVTAQTFNRGVAGTPQASSGRPANEFFIGGYGTALGQIFRRNFPNQSVSLSFNVPFGNRQAQGDYGIDQLQYRQSQLSSQRDVNNIVVDISARMSALRQARARYSAAKNTRVLQEQLLEYDRKKFASGLATFNEVILDQRTLVTAQSSELTAVANYAHARVALDQVLGETLEKNQITLEEGISGRVQRQSNPPVIGQRKP